MPTGFLVEIEAREDKVEEVEAFLHEAIGMAEREDGMHVWLAGRSGPANFLTFNTFPDAAASDAHMVGELATAFSARADELLACPPRIVAYEVVEQKLPGRGNARG
ncbi:hypothetical protein BJF90_15725 [Pseudonocardia sp. CNS-004]|nr:hypothetical protein BJF90_15725 [Pseudonocardia sp. CNS-004]